MLCNEVSMALPINIEDLIHQKVVEQSRIEYKEGRNPGPIIHSIAAFANDFDTFAYLSKKE